MFHPRSIDRATRFDALRVAWLGMFVVCSLDTRADIVELKDGGVLYGKVLNPQSGTMVQIET